MTSEQTTQQQQQPPSCSSSSTSTSTSSNFHGSKLHANQLDRVPALSSFFICFRDLEGSLPLPYPLVSMVVNMVFSTAPFTTRVPFRVTTPEDHDTVPYTVQGRDVCPLSMGAESLKQSNDGEAENQLSSLRKLAKHFASIAPTSKTYGNMHIMKDVLRILWSETMDERVKYEAARLLCNLTSFRSAVIRDSLLDRDILGALVSVLLRGPKVEDRTHLLCVKVITNLVHFDPFPPLEKLGNRLLPLLAELMHHPNLEIVFTTCTALRYIGDKSCNENKGKGRSATTSGSSSSTSTSACSSCEDGGLGHNRIRAVLEQKTILPRAVELMHVVETAQLQLAAVRIVGNVMMGNSVQAQEVINAGFLRHCVPCLRSSLRDLRQEVAWTLSNLAAGCASQLQAMFDANLFPIIINELLSDPSPAVVNESVWILNHAIDFGCTDHVETMIRDLNVLEPLCRIIKEYRQLCAETTVYSGPDKSDDVARVALKTIIRIDTLWSEFPNLDRKLFETWKTKLYVDLMPLSMMIDLPPETLKIILAYVQTDVAKSFAGSGGEKLVRSLIGGGSSPTATTSTATPSAKNSGGGGGKSKR